MNSIEIDDEVLAELSRRAVGFNVTPNLVIRRILGLSAGAAPASLPPQNETIPALQIPAGIISRVVVDKPIAQTAPGIEDAASPIAPQAHAKPETTDSSAVAPQVAVRGMPLKRFVDNRVFTEEMQSIERFTFLLMWAYEQNPEAFTRAVTDYQRGNRRYFGATREEIERSGKSIKATEIPETPFWVLSTLDNRTKRSVVEDIFRSLRHSPGDINLAKAQLADSDIKRRRTHDPRFF